MTDFSTSEVVLPTAERVMARCCQEYRALLFTPDRYGEPFGKDVWFQAILILWARTNLQSFDLETYGRIP
jgi:hypothetical protein